jgi:putative DNA primase/helicase
MEGDESPSHGRLVINRAGWRDCGGDGRWHHYVLPEVWRREVFAGMDGRAAGRTLEKRRWIRRDGSHLCPKVTTVPGIGPTRLFHVLPELFEEDDETDREGEGKVDP